MLTKVVHSKAPEIFEAISLDNAHKVSPKREEETLKQAYSREELWSAIYVQKPDDSLNSAIHNVYHILLRPSSLRELRHPMLKVMMIFVCLLRDVNVVVNKKPI